MAEGTLRHLRECPSCGQFHTTPRPAPGAEWRCRRCDAPLRRVRRDPLTPPLALAMAGIVLYALTVSMPFMGLEMRGRGIESNITSGAVQLDRQGLVAVALVVLATTIVVPLIRLGSLLVVLGGLRLEKPPRFLPVIFRWAERLSPWAMVEVFLIGVFVAYTKLIDLARIEIGPGAYALGGLMLVMIAAQVILDPEAVWEALEQRGLVAAASDQPASAGRLVACGTCHLVSRAMADGHSACPRCGSRLHFRKPGSIGRTWALLLAAAVLYLPANLYPVMTIISLGRGDPSTILGGVRELLSAGMWPLALIVFLASITVPLLKLVGLAIMLVATQLRSGIRLRDRTRLYRIITAIGRWSMIDVFMLSILVALVRLGALASVRGGIGAACFASVVILTMLATETFDPRLMWDAAGATPVRRQKTQPA